MKAEYFGSILVGMKVKTSITLSEHLLATIDQLMDKYKNRSTFLELAAWDFIARLQRAEQEALDIEIINRRADELNAETMDVLEYQVPL
jgi:metal-responsive CopG/Arc/MetJ family transcriptional regulator